MNRKIINLIKANLQNDWQHTLKPNYVDASAPLTSTCLSPPLLASRHIFPTISPITTKLHLHLQRNAFCHLFFYPSYKVHSPVNLILFLENGGFTSKSRRGVRNNPRFVSGRVHLVVTEISHLLWDPGVNGERWWLVTPPTHTPLLKNQQARIPLKRPTSCLFHPNLECQRERIKWPKTPQTFGSSYAPVSFQGPWRYLPLSWKDSAEFPVWCSFPLWGNLRSRTGSWQRRKEAEGWGGGCHGDRIITLCLILIFFNCVFVPIFKKTFLVMMKNCFDVFFFNIKARSHLERSLILYPWQCVLFVLFLHVQI